MGRPVSDNSWRMFWEKLKHFMLIFSSYHRIEHITFPTQWLGASASFACTTFEVATYVLKSSSWIELKWTATKSSFISLQIDNVLRRTHWWQPRSNKQPTSLTQVDQYYWNERSTLLLDPPPWPCLLVVWTVEIERGTACRCRRARRRSTRQLSLWLDSFEHVARQVNCVSWNWFQEFVGSMQRGTSLMNKLAGKPKYEGKVSGFLLGPKICWNDFDLVSHFLWIPWSLCWFL